jgi:hypothetical protein
VAKQAREAWGAFIAPQGNLPVGVSKTQTCPSWGPNMFGNSLYNLALEPDKSGSGDSTRGRAERPDMSGLEARRIRETSLEPE